MAKYEQQILELKSKEQLKTFIKENKDDFTNNDWYFITKSPYFTLSIADKYPENMPWCSMCFFKKMPEDFIERHIDKMDWYSLSAFHNLSRGFITKYQHRLSLNILRENENLQDDNRTYAGELYEKYNDPEHHKVWDENLKNCKIICPPNFKGKYSDYNSKTPFAYNKYKITIKKKQQTTVDPSKQDYSSLTKQQLKDILAERKIRVFYHDTLDILRKKCIESEK